jgi:hypothetical protein
MEVQTMKTNRVLIVLTILAALLLTGCGSRARVGELRTESQSVELGDSESVRVEINLGAGDLEVTGGAEKLLEAGFTYNVSELKPEVDFSNGTLVVKQPDVDGLPVLRDINGFRNEWDLRLNDELPMDLRVDMRAGSSDLQLVGLPLTGLDVSLGAGESTIDLGGDWARDLNVSIDAGAGNIDVRLPEDIGVRIEVDAGVGRVDAPGLTKDSNVYTNAAYGVSPVTLRVYMQAGIGQIKLIIEE